MKEEILIALVCASLMLITPFTVVAQENKVSNNLSEQPDIEGLVAQIRVVIDEKLEKYQGKPKLTDFWDIIRDIIKWLFDYLEGTLRNILLILDTLYWLVWGFIITLAFILIIISDRFMG